MSCVPIWGLENAAIVDLAVITTKEQLLQRRDEMCCPQGGRPSEHVVRPSGSRAPGQGQRKPPKAAAAGKSGYEKNGRVSPHVGGFRKRRSEMLPEAGSHF